VGAKSIVLTSASWVADGIVPGHSSNIATSTPGS
jgi:hypothetical protein